MKVEATVAKLKSSRRVARPATLAKPSRLPDPPIVSVDVDYPCEPITQRELNELDNAEYHFQIARADYQKKRAALALKLILGSRIEPGSLDAETDREGNLIVIETCDCGARGRYIPGHGIAHSRVGTS